MPITDDNRIIYEYRCIDCGAESEDEELRRIPLEDCPECGGRRFHVGPILAECDYCGAGLLYSGNSGLGDDTLCDGCYDRMRSGMP